MHSDPPVPPAPSDPSGPGPIDIDDTRAQLAATRRDLAAVTRRRDAQRALHDAGILDMDAGAALLEERMNADAFDPAAAAAQLLARKPALFRPSSPPVPAPASATMGLAAPAPDARHELVQAAQRAAATGDRSSLLTYLRLKRAFA